MPEYRLVERSPGRQHTTPAARQGREFGRLSMRFQSHSVTFGAALLAALRFGSPAGAQSLVVGSVSGAGRRVPHARVDVDPSGLHAVTSDSGTFSLEVRESGVVRITVRAIGFYPDSRRFLLTGNDTVAIAFELERSPQQLDSVVVEGTAPAANPKMKMQPFEDRRRQDSGDSTPGRCWLRGNTRHSRTSWR